MAQVHSDPPAYMYDGGEQAELAAAVARAEARGAPPPAYESSGLRQRRPREKEEDEENLVEPEAGAGPASSSSSSPSASAPPPPPQAHHLHARSASTVTTTTEGMRKYNMWYTTSRLSTTLHRGGPETEAEYYMQSDVMALKKPNLLLRRGPRKDGPVVAFARIRFHTRHVLIGRGDCTAPGWKIDGSGNNNKKDGDGGAAAAAGALPVGTDDAGASATTKTTTQELYRDRNIFCRSDWRFTTSAGGGELQSTTTSDGSSTAAGAPPATEFVWRKDMSKMLATVYDCVDGSTGRVCARLLSGGGFNFNKGGEIYLADGLARPLEELLLVSAEAIWAWEALNYQSLFQGYD